MNITGGSSQDKIVALFDEFVAESDKATGRTSGRARFYGFKISDQLRLAYKEATDFLREGKMNHAEIAIRKAIEWIDGAQRKFCLGQVNFFMEQHTKLPHLDDDIETSLMKKREAFKVLAESVGKSKEMVEGDLDRASEMSWELRASMMKAEREQGAREEKRRLDGSKAKARSNRVKADLAAEQSREAQLRQKEAQAQARAELADRFAAAI